MDLSLIGTWIIQGLILFGFAIAGVYVALRLFGPRPSTPPDQSASASPDVGSQTGVVPAAAAPAPAATTVAAEAAPATEPAAPSSAPAPPRRVKKSSQPGKVHQAFEFGEDDRITVVLEMPESLLDDAENLAEAWVETVGWARVERMKRANDEEEEARALAAAVDPAPFKEAKIEPEKLQAQLNEVLQRLQLSAERRRQLRSLLEEKLAAELAEEEEE
ncbi:MAG: hypothetical protein D6775_11555 [Caldilineae bacterium]|nr:MAG: hypothetical protein D6775_11555 [Caldilineae bacterium]